MKDEAKKVISLMDNAISIMESAKLLIFPRGVTDKASEVIQPLHSLVKDKLERSALEAVPGDLRSFLKSHGTVRTGFIDDFKLLKKEVKQIATAITEVYASYTKNQIDLNEIEDKLKEIISAAKNLESVDVTSIQMDFGNMLEKLTEIQKSAKDMIEHKSKIEQFKKMLLKLVDLATDIDAIVVYNKKAAVKEWEENLDATGESVFQYVNLLNEMGIECDMRVLSLGA